MGLTSFGHGWDRADRGYAPLDTRGPEAPLGPTGARMGRWDQEEARQSLRQQVLDHIATSDGVLVLDEAEFVKESGAHVGAQRYEGAEGGRSEHRQTGVFLAYSGPRGEGYLDRELFLPKCWTEQERLRLASGLPADVTYTTRPQMARQMLERAFQADVPHRCIVGGITFGADAGLRLWLERLGEPYVLGVPGREVVRVRNATLRADALVAVWPDEAWRPAAGSGSGAGGEVWAGVQVRCNAGEDWQRWLIARRSSWGSEATDYFLAFDAAGATLDDMIGSIEACRRISRGIGEARRTVGLDRFNGKSWEGWYRHMTVALMAHAMRSMVRRHVAMQGQPLEGGGWSVH